jgi:dTDP-4-dehydrorhamnose reductase
MKIVIFGSGQLGTHCYHKLKNYYGKKANVRLFSRSEIDITDKTASLFVIKNADIVINCAAFTNVDAAESSIELNNTNYNVNAIAVKNLAENCKMFNKKFIHISTDFVYGKIKDDDFIKELNETDICKPCNEYGKSKLEGEISILEQLSYSNSNFIILRVAWLYGPYGKNNFIKSIFNALHNDTLKELNVVDDQFGRPTSTELVTDVIIEFINGKLDSGIYNLTNNGVLVSKYELADYIKNLCKSNKKINRLSTDDYQKLSEGIVADRQKNSNLNISKIRQQLGKTITDWRYDVDDYVSLLIKQQNRFPLFRWVKRFMKRILNK